MDVKAPFSPHKVTVDQTVKAAFSLSFKDTTLNEEAQTKGIQNQYYFLYYGGGGGSISSIRILGKFVTGSPYDEVFAKMVVGTPQTKSGLTVALNTQSDWLTITGESGSPIITSIEVEGKYTVPGKKTITLYAGVLPKGVVERATNFAATEGLVAAPDGVVPKSVDVEPKKGAEKGVGGTFMWDIKVPDATGRGIVVVFEWVPDKKDACPCTKITMLQVVTELTVGGNPWYPGGNDDEAYYKMWSADPKKSDRIDHIRGVTAPYYGAKFDEDAKTWVSDGTGNGLGSASPALKKAALLDTPAGVRDKDFGVFVNTFETAAFCIDNQEVLGVLKWGYRIPANADDPIVLLFGDKADFSKSFSDATKKTIAKANDVSKGLKADDLMKHCQLDGSKFITKPNNKVKCAGTSALPD